MTPAQVAVLVFLGFLVVVVLWDALRFVNARAVAGRVEPALTAIAESRGRRAQ